MATFTGRPAASADDQRRHWTGSAWSYSSLTDGYTSAGYQNASIYRKTSGIRIPSVTVPQGATVSSSKVTLTCAVATAGTACNTRLSLVKTDNAAAQFSTGDSTGAFANYYAGGGSYTEGRTAEVDWDGIGAWVTSPAETVADSPSIAAIVQSIVSRAGWASGNAMVLFWDDDDDRSTHTANAQRLAYSFDGSATKCLLLTIEYTVGTAAPIQQYLNRRRVA